MGDSDYFKEQRDNHLAFCKSPFCVECNPNLVVIQPEVGDLVVCDICNDEYTNSTESGGFLFGSYAYCPKCAITALPRIKGFGEEDRIKMFCPTDMSFADFVRSKCR